MEYAPGKEPTKCSHPGCENTIVVNRWSAMKYRWFIMKDGTAYCPDHSPAWVEEWRNRRLSDNK